MPPEERKNQVKITHDILISTYIKTDDLCGIKLSRGYKGANNDDKKEINFDFVF